MAASTEPHGVDLTVLGSEDEITAGTSQPPQRKVPRQTQRAQQRGRKAVANDDMLDEEDAAWQPPGKKDSSSKKRRLEEAAEAPSGAKSPHKKKGTTKAAPAPKRQPKPKPVKEDRVDRFGKSVRWSPAPSIAVQQRIQRALPGSAHRLFLLDFKQLTAPGMPGGGAYHFNVLGATGNVYDVAVDRSPRCSCPDAAKGNVCKHLLFVMLRVLKLPSTEPLVWQRGLLASEVDAVLSGERSRGSHGEAPDVLADESVRDAYAAALRQRSGHQADGADGANSTVRKPPSGDCAVCFDTLEGQPEHELEWCRTCGNSLHIDCWKRWSSTKRSQHAPLTCVYCRSASGKHPGQEQQAAATEEDDKRYINLAAASPSHARTSMTDLYGSRAIWIDYYSGRGGSRAQAARAWRAAGGDRR